jgi:hypothetical protein
MVVALCVVVSVVALAIAVCFYRRLGKQITENAMALADARTELTKCLSENAMALTKCLSEIKRIDDRHITESETANDRVSSLETSMVISKSVASSAVIHARRITLAEEQINTLTRRIAALNARIPVSGT